MENDKKIQLHVVFGSTSDEEYVLPGIQKVTGAIPGLSVWVHYASADNTPEKIRELFPFLRQIQASPKVFISGAGLSNALTSTMKSYAWVEDLVIGIPITDSSSGGLSSVYSTFEKPPLNPVLGVGINNTYAALNIAYKFLTREKSKVIVLGTLDLQSKCNLIGLSYDMDGSNISEDDIIIKPFYHIGSHLDEIVSLDDKLSRGGGIQIVFDTAKLDPAITEPNTLYMADLRGSYFTDYMQFLKRDLKSTGFVGTGRYENAVYMAAILNRDKKALDYLSMEKEKKEKTLGDEKGLLVEGGNVTKL